MLLSFNPTMVRLRLVCLPVRPCAAVSIPLWCDCDELWALYELIGKLVSIPLWCDCDRLTAHSTCSVGICFNPTMVRLRRSGRAVLSFCSVRFNPTMVRLRLLKRIFTRLPDSGFNPTMVRLRQQFVSKKVEQSFHRFNPTMVRLRLARLEAAAALHELVSIPLWCDCD